MAVATVRGFDGSGDTMSGRPGAADKHAPSLRQYFRRLRVVGAVPAVSRGRDGGAGVAGDVAGDAAVRLLLRVDVGGHLGRARPEAAGAKRESTARGDGRGVSGKRPVRKHDVGTHGVTVGVIRLYRLTKSRISCPKQWYEISYCRCKGTEGTLWPPLFGATDVILIS